MAAEKKENMKDKVDNSCRRRKGEFTQAYK